MFELIEPAKELLGHAVQSQFAQMTIAFILAWKAVRKDMKKEIADQFTKVVASIDAVTHQLSEVKETFSNDLAAYAKRLANVEDGVSELKTGIKTIDSRLGNLEPKP